MVTKLSRRDKMLITGKRRGLKIESLTAVREGRFLRLNVVLFHLIDVKGYYLGLTVRQFIAPTQVEPCPAVQP